MSHSSALSGLVPQHIQRIDPYIPSPPDDVLCRRFNVAKVHRLNNNENPLGPPPTALQAMKDYPVGRAAVYPSGDSYHLRQALADRHGLDRDQFLVGNGANEVISFVTKAFCEVGDNIITADKTFAVYEWVAEFSGVKVNLVPLKGFGFDAQAMAAAMDSRTKIVFVCNPNNPTGTYWNETVFRNFMEEVGRDVVVVLDEAYAEFVEAPDFPDGLRLLEEYPNLVVFRTFSKVYGLAGLRIGYLAASTELVHMIRRTCVVYSVNGLAQVAAHAALQDEQHIPSTLNLVRESRDYLCFELERMALEYQAGAANFVMVRLPLSDTLAYQRLMSKGYMVRPMTAFRYPNHIRVSLVSLPIMQGFVGALESLLR